MIQHSLQAWATALGIERRTLEARLVKSGFTVPKRDGNGIQAKRVFVAMIGEADAEKNRLTAAQASKVERENAMAEGIIHTRDGIERELWDAGLSKVRESWLGYEKTTGAKLKAILTSAGMPADIIQRVITEAAKGVTEPIEKLKATLPSVQTQSRHER